MVYIKKYNLETRKSEKLKNTHLSLTHLVHVNLLVLFCDLSYVTHKH